MYTDGSLSELGDTGAGFVIPDLKLRKSYYLGKQHSIFSAELIAILMALYTIYDIPKQFFSILFCVDSQSALIALQTNDPKERSEIIYEIRHLIDVIIQRGTKISFCWVPSHCGLKHNDQADLAAKQGSKFSNACEIKLPYSLREKYHIINSKFCKPKSDVFAFTKGYSRRIISLAFRLFLNSWTTKFANGVNCTCQEKITIDHIIFHCKDLKNIHEMIQVKNVSEISFKNWLEISETLLQYPIEQYL